MNKRLPSEVRPVRCSISPNRAITATRASSDELSRRRDNRTEGSPVPTVAALAVSPPCSGARRAEAVPLGSLRLSGQNVADSSGVAMIVDPSRWHSFEEFEADVRGLPETARGDAFEDFTHAYLTLTPELALSDVWPIRDTPTDVLAQLGLRPDDIGVDFVGRRHA